MGWNLARHCACVLESPMQLEAVYSATPPAEVFLHIPLREGVFDEAVLDKAFASCREKAIAQKDRIYGSYTGDCVDYLIAGYHIPGNFRSDHADFLVTPNRNLTRFESRPATICKSRRRKELQRLFRSLPGLNSLVSQSSSAVSWADLDPMGATPPCFGYFRRRTSITGCRILHLSGNFSC